MTFGHHLHGIPQPVGVERSGQGQVQLHRIQIGVRTGLRGVEQQSLLQRGHRQDVGDRVLTLELVDLPLVQERRRDIRRRQTAATGADQCADTSQRVEPQPAQPLDLLAVQRRRRPRPVGMQLRAGFGVHGARVELHGVHQWHRYRGRCAGDLGCSRAVPADLPQLVGQLGPTAESAEVVESDCRIGCFEVDSVVEVSQQTVGQPIGQCPQLLLGVLEHRGQRGVTGCHLRPRHVTDRDGYRVLGGEPADGA